MPATSKQQQRLMGIVHALQTGQLKPGKASKKAQQMAKSMKKSDVKDFASTKHKGLPKKVKKEEMAIPTMFLVRKPMDGMTAEKMVCEINPLEGIQPLNINMNDVHSVHATAEDAQQIAAEAYQKYCDEAIALEEKKDTTSGKIKKAIDQLEKKRKEHLTLAKDDPKSASKHKEHIAKIATQIDDLMTKLERIEKSKKQIEKAEDKKELKEADDKKMDISFVKDIHDEETLLSKFPKAKKLYDKVSHGFWDLNGDKKIFARVDFKQSGEGTKVGDFDPSSFDISTVYKMVGKDKHGLGEPVYLYKK